MNFVLIAVTWLIVKIISKELLNYYEVAASWIVEKITVALKKNSNIFANS